MNKKIDLEMTSLSDEDVLELYKKIEEHRDYLEKNIINIDDEQEENNEKEGAKKDESTK